MRRLAVSIPVLLTIGLFAFFMVMTLRGEKEPTQSRLISHRTPAFSLASLSSDTPVSLDDYKSGPVIVNFFASWCTPCRAEHPVLMDLQARGVNIIGINYKDQPELAQAFIDELGNPFIAIGQDSNGRTGIDFGITGVPETFVISRKGEVLTGWAGPLDRRILNNKILPALQADEIANTFSPAD